MKRKQILALAIAIAFTAQPQIANAAEPEGQSEVNIEAAENDSEETEVTEGTEDTELIFPQIKELSGIVKAAGTDGGVVDGKLATVRVTNTDVYGIVGGKASLVGNYDQGQPAVPKDGIAWCYGDKTKVVADANKYGNPESTTMTLRNIEASQDGQTFCLSATNEVGTAYSPLVTLHVLDASVADQTVAVGNTATFTIEKTGNWGSYIQYQWYKGDQKISGATKAVLTLENVTSADAGEYKCVVQRGFGRADEYNSKTVTATLTVGKLATVRVTNTDVYGIVGGKASLVGNYDQGQPAVPKDGIAWCYGDKTKVVADANKYGNPESTTMTLRNIEASQDGQTFCLSATNEVGTAYSPLVTLHVLDAKSENQTALTDEDVTLAVETTGDWGSYVKYQWYKGTQKISGATKAALTLENVTLEDAGEYRCIVQKGFGRADEYNSKTVDVTLEVKERILDTKITSSHDGKAVKKGTKVSFKAEAIGDWGDELSYQWYDKDGKPIADQEPYAGATTDTLTVTAQNSLDGMGYYCVITGAYGSTQTETSTLNVKAEDSSNKDDKNVSTKKDTTKKTESKTNPVKTGDSAQTGLWAVIAGLGLIEILEILKNKVKR